MQAKFRLNGRVHRTPLVHSQTFSRMAGCELYMKMENMQRTGAFKVRGAMNKIASLTPEERAAGVVTASAGNHAQGVALAAAQAGIRSTVVMPTGAPDAKVSATEEYGSTVVLHGATYDEAYEHATRIARTEGATFVHAFDDRHVIAGQGTVGIEIVDDLPDVDAILVPVGGGGLLSGIALAAKTVRPDIRVIGVQPETARSGYDSWRNRAISRVEKPVSVADGLLVKRPGDLPLRMMLRYVDDFALVSEEEIAAAMIMLLERAKVLAEGAGAVGLAAVLNRSLGLEGKRVALVLSGGNVDLVRWANSLTPKTLHHA
ncbi:threonine ammonia-lyase [Paenibacillus flagellatus]|uniref:L-threonine dehydratase catabolic TdcB n=1 Tax=Paenibacillus flagellatus TaxID=2211139 RepID=A0A2V5KCJ1_9BACL|nr:threonine ammonia-lyase [Paenibacillus flagellatus]PYI55884.1 threonine ammonia-lyase [Paenibacillus flagellatus]